MTQSNMVSLSPSSPPASSSRSPAFMSSTSQDHLEEEDCTECLVNCQDPACVSELSQQCTDDCFIVPCDDPNHSALCMDEDCAALCDSSADCSFTHRPVCRFNIILMSRFNGRLDRQSAAATCPRHNAETTITLQLGHDGWPGSLNTLFQLSWHKPASSVV